MSAEDTSDLSEIPLLDLFRQEVEEQCALMTAGLLELERDPSARTRLDELMRSAHSLKGAARIVNRDAAVKLAHAMEDCFLAVQRGTLVLGKKRIDLLLRAIDLLMRSAQTSESDLTDWQTEHRSEIEALVRSFSTPATDEVPISAPLTTSTESDLPKPSVETAPAPDPMAAQPAAVRQTGAPEPAGRALRIAPEAFNRLLGLSGETVVAARWLETFKGELLELRRLQDGVNRNVNRLSDSLSNADSGNRLQAHVAELKGLTAECRQALVSKIEEFERFDRRVIGLASRLHEGVLDCRMRPFADVIRGFPRMVRDVAHRLGKQVHLQCVGESTPVDRDILERLEAPLNHLLRNAIDHGIETPSERRAVGKPEEGAIRLEARHNAGLLFITVSDDGRGLNMARLREAVVTRKLTSAAIAEKLSDEELVQFLFLPGFTTKETVTEISGRGVGLDAVQVLARETGGSVRVVSSSGPGLTVELRLPLTLSVLRALLVDIAGEAYAFPLGRISRVIKLRKEEIESVEGREHFTLGTRQIGLVAAQQVLGIEVAPVPGDELAVIVLGDESAGYGLVVDHFLGEGELVVRPLDPRLGNIKDISAAALLADQSPVLIVDVEGMIRSIENLVAGRGLAQIRRDPAAAAASARKRVLVVEDSLTVRELERKLLDSSGYHVDTAVDGMEGWNAVRSGQYDLVVTDVDMPRLDGIELIKLIRKDARLRSLPVMIVSYKDREEDRRRGLDAGADYYVAKGAFHHDALLRAVADLIGNPQR